MTECMHHDVEFTCHFFWSVCVFICLFIYLYICSFVSLLIYSSLYSFIYFFVCYIVIYLDSYFRTTVFKWKFPEDGPLPRCGENHWHLFHFTNRTRTYKHSAVCNKASTIMKHYTQYAKSMPGHTLYICDHQTILVEQTQSYSTWSCNHHTFLLQHGSRAAIAYLRYTCNYYGNKYLSHCTLISNSVTLLANTFHTHQSLKMPYNIQETSENMLCISHELCVTVTYTFHFRVRITVTPVIIMVLLNYFGWITIVS